MRGELNTQWRTFGIEKMPARRRRRQWGATLALAGGLLVLAALTGWLVYLVRLYSAHFTIGPVPGLALAPVTEGMLVGLLLFGSAAAVAAAVRKMRETDRWVEQIRHRRLAELRDPLAEDVSGLHEEEVHRILTAMACEGREIKRMVCGALDGRRAMEEREDQLDAAADRVARLVRCAEALSAGLRAEQGAATLANVERRAA